jgi:osmotically inducible protein OsmC
LAKPAGFTPQRVSTTAKVSVDKVGDGFKITKIRLESEAVVPNIDNGKFQEIAAATKTGCPVSGALAAVPMELDAKLVK